MGNVPLVDDDNDDATNNTRCSNKGTNFVSFVTQLNDIKFVATTSLLVTTSAVGLLRRYPASTINVDSPG